VRRREFIGLLGGATVAWPLAASSQQADRVRRIGVLMMSDNTDPEALAWVAKFVQRLQELGWMDGQNLRIDYRWAGDAKRAESLAAELVGLAPDARR